MTNSITEYTRLEEERYILIDHIRSSQASSAVKEKWLRELREIEAKLGIKGQPYNSSAWPDGYRAEDER